MLVLVFDGSKVLRKVTVKYTYSILDFQNHDVQQEDFSVEGQPPTQQEMYGQEANKFEKVG